MGCARNNRRPVHQHGKKNTRPRWHTRPCHTHVHKANGDPSQGLTTANGTLRQRSIQVHCFRHRTAHRAERHENKSPSFSECFLVGKNLHAAQDSPDCLGGGKSLPTMHLNRKDPVRLLPFTSLSVFVGGLCKGLCNAVRFSCLSVNVRCCEIPSRQEGFPLKSTEHVGSNGTIY